MEFRPSVSLLSPMLACDRSRCEAWAILQTRERWPGNLSLERDQVRAPEDVRFLLSCLECLQHRTANRTPNRSPARSSYPEPHKILQHPDGQTRVARTARFGLAQTSPESLPSSRGAPNL